MNGAGETRQDYHGWSLRRDEALEACWRGGGWWIDETAGPAAQRLAKGDPGRVLVIDGQTRLTASRLVADAERLAAHMGSRGIAPGNVVSFMLPNWHEAAVIYLAATLAGAVAHPIVPQLRDQDVSFMLADSASRMIFVPASFRGFDYPAMMSRLNASLPRPVETVVLRGDAGENSAFDALLATGAPDAGLPRRVDPGSVKMLMYTSGTTGRPKGVLHSHNSLYALVRQIGMNWHVGEGDRFFVPSPISHIGGSIYAFEMPLLCGTSAVLQDQWDPAQAVALIDTEWCTHMAGATPFLKQLLSAADASGSTLESLKVFICGGASVAPSLIQRARTKLPGTAVSRVYGSTEMPVLTVGALEPGEEEQAARTDGRIGIAEVRLIDATDAQANGDREIAARGPQMLRGYLSREDEDGLFTSDGYFRTGDLARIEDGGYVVITGRCRDIIIRNGENIAPKEIEDILIDHPAIAAVAIIGIADARTGERACAVIVPEAGSAPDCEALAVFLRERGVAKFKWPEQVELRAELPTNAAGKVMKHVLQRELAGAPA